MNVIWIVTDTFRRDHLGAYGNDYIHTPTLDALAASSVRFDTHYATAFPTMSTRADHFTGRWTMSFMGWQPFVDDVTTLGSILSDEGIHTAAVIDTPFYWRHGFNYDRGFQTFFTVQGQEGSPTRVRKIGHHESRNTVAWWRKESDRNVAKTMVQAGDWLERHYTRSGSFSTWTPGTPRSPVTPCAGRQTNPTAGPLPHAAWGAGDQLPGPHVRRQGPGPQTGGECDAALLAHEGQIGRLPCHEPVGDLRHRGQVHAHRQPGQPRIDHDRPNQRRGQHRRYRQKR